MSRIIGVLTVLMLFGFSAAASVIKGKAYDNKTGEPLIGATVHLQPNNIYTTTGLDGSFVFKNLSEGTYIIEVSYISYKKKTKEVHLKKDEHEDITVKMESDESMDLAEVVVSGRRNGSSELTARSLERSAPQVMNIVSGRAIEISPDITVANVVQRVSGVSIERNASGDGQYAILRGMDKRYNYTLVNGVKLPSPDNKYRYLPLDIFPAELMDRLEIYKSLTPNLEGDAIGGAVNMVMKDAPDQLQISANIATGYSQIFMDRDYLGYSANSINHQSPYEQNGKGYQAKPADFTKGTIDYKNQFPAPNIVGGLSIGSRFFDKKFGAIIAGSYQNTYRGNNSEFFSSSVVDVDKFATITNMDSRQYSEQQKRFGLHSKLDYTFNQRHKLQWYNAYMDLSTKQIRDIVSTNFSSDYDPANGNAQLNYNTRSRLSKQGIFNSTLQGKHELIDGKLNIHWSAAYSSATNKTPDNTTISLYGLRTNNADKITTVDKSTRRWEHNSDEDKAAYLDLDYKTNVFNTKVVFSIGGLYRDKQRNNFYNNYELRPVNQNAVYGVDFTDYTQISWNVQNPNGAVANALSYDASEKITAGYGMFRTAINQLKINGGVRLENTDQGYKMLFPAGELRPVGNQTYLDVLPSLNLTYLLGNKQNLHASYFRSVNRPGFFEIVPGKVVNEEFQERGNADLQRAIADNIDLRYELFPKATDQYMIGAFYKKIENPIEYTLQPDAVRGQDIYYSPGNFGNATNYGIELDVIKYFRKIGIKANYTYTHSSITTPKSTRIRNAAGDLELVTVDQTRPLYGQSEHIANVSLLYKDGKKGWDGQLAMSYTGPRINTVSQFLNNDLWQEGFVQLDASIEKRFRNQLSIFIKANNLLNTPTRLYIKGINVNNDGLPEQSISSGKTLIRNENYYQTYLIGARYKF